LIGVSTKDRAARVWRMRDLQKDKPSAPAVLLSGHGSGVRSAGFYKTGREAATVAKDEHVWLWDINVSDVKARLSEASVECPPESELKSLFVGLQKFVDTRKIHDDCMKNHHEPKLFPVVHAPAPPPTPPKHPKHEPSAAAVGSGPGA